MNFQINFYKDDPIFLDKFNNLIKDFQTQIQRLNIEHIESKITSVTAELDNKIELIKNFDPLYEPKSKVVQEQAVKRHANSLTKSTEKINKLISLANNPAPSTTTQIAQKPDNINPIVIIESSSVNNQAPINNQQNKQHNKNYNNQQRTSNRKTNNQYSSTAVYQQQSQGQHSNQNNQYNNNNSSNYNRPQSSANNYSYRSDIPTYNAQSI